MSNSNNKQFKNLRLWNGIMSILHFVQGIIMYSLSTERLTDIVLNLPKPNPTQRSFGLEAEKWFSLNLGQTISIFLFLSAFAHLITILPKVYPWYIENLREKMNLIRWYEYALSSSVMVLVIAVLCGITDGATLLLLVGVNACMNLFGASMEMHNSTLRKLGHDQVKTETIKEGSKIVSQKEETVSTFRPNWWHFIYGCFAGILPWIVMGIYFFVSLDRLGNLEELPDRVKEVLNTVRFIFPALFVFFNLFAINMFLQYRRVGPWKDYLFGEKAYIILSLVAKSFLAWFIFGGTLRP